MSVMLTLMRPHGQVLAGSCTLADSPYARLKGLLGRSHLDSGEALFMATSAVHTSFMRFPIDVVFLDRDMRVVKIVADLPPWRMAAARGAHAVLELPAGECERTGLTVGETLSLGAEPSPNGVGPSDQRRVRVLVATPDARFGKVATFLLARQGFEVETHRDVEKVVDVVREHSADVVVLDGTGGIAAAARVSRAVDALDPHTGVVVVADEKLDGNSRLPEIAAMDVLPKWAAFEDIVEAVHATYRRANLHELD